MNTFPRNGKSAMGAKALFNLSANARKLWRSVGTGRTAVMAVLLLGLLLPACRDDSGEESSAWLRVMAFADAPVVGADVHVYLDHIDSQPTPLATVPTATNKQGVFSVAVPSSLFHSGAKVRVTVSGGTRNGNPFLGHLRADAVLTDPAHQIVAVNPVTTLVSLLSDARPNLRLEEAKARVRSFLGLPEGYDLGMALRESSGYGSPFFSPTVLLAEVERSGVLLNDFLEGKLLQELLASESAKRPFLNTTLQAPEGIVKFIAKSLASGALRYIGGQGVGWVTQATGLVQPDATEDDIAALQQGLADLQSSVDSLNSQVKQLSLLVQSESTKTQYNAIVVPATELAAQVTTVQNRLQYFAQECPPLPQGSVEKQPTNFCSTEKAAILEQLNDITIYSAYDVLEDWVQDNPTTGFSGMLHLYSLWLGQSKGFFRPADSTKMQNLYDYWDDVLTAAANLRVELLHQEGEQDEGGTQLIALMGNPDVDPPTTGIFQDNQDANLALMFPPVPPDTVVSTADHTMWALLPWVVNYQAETIWPQPYCYYRFVPLADTSVTQGYAGLDGWLGAPTKAMWQAALTLAPSEDTGPNWSVWFNSETLANEPESPTSAGFYTHCESTYPECYWTSTPDGKGGYNVVCLLSNSFLTSTSGPDYNISYPVRTLAPDEQYFWYE